MRIRRRWATNLPMPSNRPSHEHQIEEKKNSMAAATAAREGLHRDQLPSAWPENISNRPVSLQPSNNEKCHSTLTQQPTTSPTSTRSTKSNELIPLDHNVGSKKIAGMPPHQSHVQTFQEKEERESIEKSNGKGTGSIGNERSSTRKEHSPSAITTVEVLPSSPLEGKVSRWSEGERAFPFKKRRGSYDWGEDGGETLVEKEKNMKSKMKKKTSSKYEQDEDFNEEEEDQKAAVNRMVNRKARNAGGPLMEGSRCSRVNGRGWRCSHKTLVGYSLCEHHLGKGRMKSIGSMGGISELSSAITRPMKDNANDDEDDGELGMPFLVVQKYEGTSVEDGDEKEEEVRPMLPMVVVKKKRGSRLGWRRLDYSLLGQPHRATPS